MKFLTVLLTMMIQLTVSSFSQVTFSVSPSLLGGGASIGYQSGRYVPSLSLQYFGGSFNYDHSYKQYQNGQIVDLNDKYDVAASVYFPSLALKYFINDSKDLRLYGTIGVGMAFITSSSSDSAISKDISDRVSKFRAVGLELGIGSEYFLSPKFSIGGEFGLRFLFLNDEYSYQTDVYNPDNSTYTYYNAVTKMSSNLRMTNAKVILNYYF